MKPHIEISVVEGETERVLVNLNLRVGEKVAFKPSEFKQGWDKPFHFKATIPDSKLEIHFQSPHWIFTPSAKSKKRNVEGTITCVNPEQKHPFEIRICEAE